MTTIKRIIKTFSALALVLLLAAGLAACAVFQPKTADDPGAATEIAEAPVVSAKPAAGADDPDPEPAALPEPALTEKERVISVDQVIEYANNSKYLMEFAQRFFSDYIIYTDSSGRFTYAPVDKSMPLSDYNWDNLVPVPGSSNELTYIENNAEVSIKGIDVSRYQGAIDWEKVAADGVKFAFIRLGYRGYSTAKLVIDEQFENNIKGAVKAGVNVGVYFVTQAVSVEEAIEEANFVLEAIAPYKVTYPIVLDIEDAASDSARTNLLTAEERTDYTIAFCEEVKKKGYTPMLYCNIRWFMEKLELSRLTGYDKWFAQYFSRPFFPYEFQVWQYSSKGRVDGIKGDVDLNLCFVDYANR